MDFAQKLRMQSVEALLNVQPLPEVEAAVLRIINSPCCAVVKFFDEVREETVDGRPIAPPIGDYDEDEIAKMIEEADDDDFEQVVTRMYGMPLITLHFFRISPENWELQLRLSMLNTSEMEDAPSQYALFRLSKFGMLFGDYINMNNIAQACINLGKNAYAAIKLISYYVRYYGYGMGKNCNIKFDP